MPQTETYIVAFEAKNNEHLEALEAKLMEFETFCPINRNCWAIVSDKEPVNIIEILDEALPEQTRIFVMRSGGTSAWRSYGKENSDWLKERL